jgi:hypothetical protein
MFHKKLKLELVSVSQPSDRKKAGEIHNAERRPVCLDVPTHVISSRRPDRDCIGVSFEPGNTIVTADARNHRGYGPLTTPYIQDTPSHRKSHT